MKIVKTGISRTPHVATGSETARRFIQGSFSLATSQYWEYLSYIDEHMGFHFNNIDSRNLEGVLVMDKWE